MAYASLDFMSLNLEVVTENLSAARDHVFPEFDEDPRFNSSWWHAGSAKSPVSYCVLLDEGLEVARAKVLPNAGEYGGYTSWSCPRGGVTEIDLFEVRVDLRGQGVGFAAVEEIARHYGDPVVAMSLNESSDPFWRSLGWIEHRHPEGDRFRNLFSSV